MHILKSWVRIFVVFFFTITITVLIVVYLSISHTGLFSCVMEISVYRTKIQWSFSLTLLPTTRHLFGDRNSSLWFLHPLNLYSNQRDKSVDRDGVRQSNGKTFWDFLPIQGRSRRDVWGISVINIRGGKGWQILNYVLLYQCSYTLKSSLPLSTHTHISTNSLHMVL